MGKRLLIKDFKPPWFREGVFVYVFFANNELNMQGNYVTPFKENVREMEKIILNTFFSFSS